MYTINQYGLPQQYGNHMSNMQKPTTEPKMEQERPNVEDNTEAWQDYNEAVEDEEKEPKNDNRIKDGTNEIEILMKRAIQCFANGVEFHRKNAIDSQMMCLQGFKRLHRCESRRNNEMMMKLQHYCVDMFSEPIEPIWPNTEQKHDNVEAMLQEFLNFELYQYGELSDVSNQLILKNCVYESILVKSEIECVVDKIRKVRRYLQDFEFAGWGWHHIKVFDHILHEKMKQREKDDYNYED